MLTNNRRDLLKSVGCGFGYLALNGISAKANESKPINPLAVKLPHFPAKIKRVIFVFMQGGPSQVDTFDPKERLTKDNGKKIEFKVARTRKITPMTLKGSPWKFKKYGECGQPVSELFPEIAKHVDDLCFIKSMHTEGVAHGPSTIFMHTGATNLIRPSVGSWISYGLGTENENLPSFITLSPSPTKGGPRNYGNAFLPTIHQGTAIGRPGIPVSVNGIKYIRNQNVSESQQREQLGLLQSLNRAQVDRQKGNDELEATISSFELAYRMQKNAPEVMDLADETEATKAMYGIGKKETDEFGKQCIMARRFAEAGVRFIQVNYSDQGNTPKWDQHSNLEKHAVHAKATDLPVAGLLADLKQRGLLEDTLVWWGGEFGRTPFAQGTGRDHNPNGFSVFLAGAGVKKGFSHGQTDEFGYNALVDKVHMHDLHATILHLLGLNHEKLTYRYAGRDFRLTDLQGHVVHNILT